MNISSKKLKNELKEIKLEMAQQRIYQTDTIPKRYFQGQYDMADRIIKIINSMSEKEKSICAKKQKRKFQNA